MPVVTALGGGCNSQVASETCHGESLARLAAGTFTNMKNKKQQQQTNRQKKKEETR